MVETVTFPVFDCPSCGPNKLLSTELSESDELQMVCMHCGHAAEGSKSLRFLPASGLDRFGYEVEGELETLGCGSGDSGCASCGSNSCG
ncbi:MAG: hypothetical protein KC561_17645 [Myxococcales bacterium]|nr:hypothetical protein [Myxococcales bacterium]